MVLVQSEISDWLLSLAAVLVTDEIDAGDISKRLSKAAKMDVAEFAGVALDVMRIIGETVRTASDFDGITVADFASSASLDIAKILLSEGLCIAAPRVHWTARPQARAARSRIGAAGEDALAIVSQRGGDGVDLYQWLAKLTELAVRIVSDQAANAVPVVRVETGISQPSTVLAYRLYGDATRAESVVDIARSATPMAMPVGFDALES